MTLWGGIPQDALLPAYNEEAFEEAVIHAIKDAAQDPGMMLGIADRVPIEADLGRLARITELLKQESS